MDYIRRRISSGNVQTDINDSITTTTTTTTRLSDCSTNIIHDQSSNITSNFSTRRTSFTNQLFNITKGVAVSQQNGSGLSSMTSISNMKFKVLFVIDNQHKDWSKYFKNRRILADYDIRVEQAEFKEINLSAHSNDGVLININADRKGIHIVRSFRPDFVLVRQYVKDVNANWINIILGLQYGAVPCVNSLRALYNFQDKPWIFAELLKIQKRLGAEQFPLINQAYYPNKRKMFIPSQYPSVIKVGHAHQGLGKVLIRYKRIIKVSNSYDYEELKSIISMSKCYSTIEPFIHGQFDIYIQKIGHHYKAFSRKSLSHNWKTNIGSSEYKQIEMTERYRSWIDEVSQIFGGLDICAVELIQSKSGKEYIFEINDSTMELIGDTEDDDCRLIAELILHKMQIYCRPNQERTVLTRISSFDELPKLLQLNTCENTRKSIKNLFSQYKSDDRFVNFKRTLLGIFNDITS